MPNQLDSVLLDPGAVTSGGKTVVTIRYQASMDAELLLSCSAAFQLAPTTIALTPSAAGSAVFDLTITRVAQLGPHECLVHFTFGSDERRRFIEVT